MQNAIELPPPPPGRFGWPWTECSPPFSECMPNGKPWPKISIVTPSFNQGHYLEETIRSVLVQGYPNLEYIIIDGGSTDNSVEIIKKYEKHLTYWVSENDKGQTHALNKGFAIASGEILAYLNSDDLYLPYTFKVVATVFRQFNLDWLTGIQSRIVAGNVIAPKRNAVSIFSKNLIRKGYHFGSLIGWNQQCSTFWSKQLFDKVGRMFDENFQHAMDIDMWIRMSHFADLVSIEATLALMRLHPDQKSRNLNIAEKELRRKYKEYRHAWYPLRKAIWFLYNIPVIRKALRICWENGEGRYIIWDAGTENWKLLKGYIR